jgi:hypothetical protein
MLGSRADTGLIFDAIAGLNAEAVAVMAMGSASTFRERKMKMEG